MENAERSPATALLEELASRRVTIRAEGGHLRLQGPKGALTPSLHAALTRCKAQVLELLQDRAGEPPDTAAATPAAPQVSRAPVSPVQQGLWFLARLEPGDRSYHLAVVLRLAGDFRPRLLERCLAEVVRRHGVLRTTFGDGPEGALQTIHPPWEPRLDVADGGRWSSAAVERWIDAEIEEPFDLERGPLFRTSCLRRSGRRYVVVLTLHHIVGDAWAMGVLLRELEALYGAFLEGAASPLPEVPLSYAAHAADEHRRLAAGRWKEQLEFWRRQLTPLPPLLALPTDRPRPALRSHRGGHLVLPLDTALVDELRAVSRAADATLFMTLAAALSLLLGRLAGERDVALAVPLANRLRRETEALLGLFVNTVVLRTGFSADGDFRALLARVRRAALAAYAHAELPFGALVQELQPPRQSGRTPLVRAMFNLADVSEIRLDLPGIRTAARLREPGSRFDFTLYVLLEADAARLEVAWDLDLFDHRRMEELLAQYRGLLAQVAAHPERGLDEYSLRTPGFAAVLAPSFRRPTALAPAAFAHERFARWVRKVPERPAVRDGERCRSYGELAQDAHRLAHHLRACGVGRGEVVAVLGARSADLAWALLGILESGAAFAVLDPEHPDARLAACLRAAQPRGWIDLTGRAAGRVLDDALERSALRCRLERPLAAGAAWRRCPPRPPATDLGGDDLAYVAFTSGTTGQPMAVATPHRPLAHYLAWFEATCELRADERFSLLCGLGHDPLVRDVFAPLSLGATLCCPPSEVRRDSARLAAWMGRAEITVSHLPPALGELLVAARRSLPALRHVFFAGDVLPWRTVRGLEELAPALRSVNFYGTTETPQAMASYEVATGGGAVGSGTGAVPLGGGIAGVELLVLNATGEAAGCGELGEVAVRTRYLARGYLGDPARTAERFVPGGDRAGARLFRTGDLGRYRPGGAVELSGRRDRQLRIRGFRIEPAEVESALVRHPAVAQAVVVSRTVSVEGMAEERLVAYLVARAKPPDDLEAELRADLHAALPEFMVPSVFSRLDRLPLTPNGKLDSAALPEPSPERRVSAAPRTPQEEAIAALWAELLGYERIGRDEDFFALGGHSLLAPRLLTRFGELFGSDMTLRELFARPTVAAMAAHLGGRRRRVPPVEPGAPASWKPSSAQRRLWFLAQLEPSSPAYLLARAFTLRGTLDPAAIDCALAEIVRRHRVLRGALVDAGGEPELVVRPAPRALLATVDLNRLPAESRRAEARRRAAREARRPFDLAGGAFLRATLLRLAAGEHVLLLTLHHVAADAGSIAVLRRELAELYAAFHARRPSPLAEPGIQYPDFAAWQERRARDGAYAGPMGYWRRQLRKPPLFDLPFSRPRRAGRILRGAARRGALPGSLTRSLHELGRRSGATLFMTLLAAWKLLLSRLSGQTDFAVGTAVSQRPAAAEGLVGLFLDTVVLRTDLGGEPSFRELLRRVRRTALDAYAHQDVPFEQLVAELQPEHDLDRPPFFQVFFNLIDADAHRFELAGLKVTELPRAPELTAKLDLALHVLQRAGTLETVLVYNADLYEAGFMAEMLAQLGYLLEQVVARPESSLSEISLATPERGPLLPDPTVRLTAPLYPPPAESFLAWAEQAPEQTALRHRERTWSYGELAAAADSAARGLVAREVSPGEVVALHAAPGFGLVAGLLGVFLSRGVVLLVDPGLPAARRRLLLREARARFLVEIAPAGDLGDEVPPGRRLPLPSARASRPAAALPTLGWDDAAYVFFTSGSTGVPKGVLGSHRALGHFLTWQRTELGIGPGDRVAQLSSPSFDAVLRDILLPLTSGASLCLPGGEELSSDPLGWMAREQVTVAHLIPSVAHFWLTEPAPAVRLPALRRLFFVGEPLPAELVRRFRAVCSPAAEVVNLYGPTETTLVKCFHRIPAEVVEGVQPVGRPLPQTQALLLGAGDRLCGVGEPGEIVLRTPFRSLGYLADSGSAFTPNPFRDPEPADLVYRTGDRGYFRPDGTLAIHGRLDQQVKIRGVRIEPGEIEALLAEHPAVTAAVVVADGHGPAADGPAARRLAAYLVAAGAPPEPHELSAFLRRRLPDVLVPSTFVTLAELPRTVTGKVDRGALRHRARPAPAPDEGRTAPRTSTETVLTALWCELLEVEEIGVHDDFFALGGHSLLASRMLARLRRRFGVAPPLRRLFEGPTVAALAGAFDETSASTHRDDEPALTPASEESGNGAFPLSFAQQRLWFLEQLEPGSGAYHLTRSLPLGGTLDVAALERSLLEIVRRHGALRTVFESRGGEPVQRLADPPAGLLAVIDLRRLGPARRRRELRRQVERQAARPFDLAGDPLLRVLVPRLGDRQWRLVLTFHHIAVDGGSLEVFGRELAALYGAFHRGRPSTLAGLGVRYVDFARWQRAWLNGARQERLLAYWRRQLAALPSLELPTDRSRPPATDPRCGRCALWLPLAEAEPAAAMARRCGVTLYMALLAVFQTLLHRVTAQDDVVVGTPIANRPRPEVEPLIGFFANTLVLRGDLRGDPAFTTLSTRLRPTCLDAYTHQDLPFEVLVKALDPDRDTSRNPLFQVLFALQELTSEDFGLPGLSSGPVETHGRSAKFDLQLSLIAEGGVLRGFLEYRSDLFDDSTARRLAGHFRHLLAACAARPEARLSELALLTPGERHHLLAETNDTRRGLGADVCLHTLLAEQVRRRPEAVALRSGAADLTYAELSVRAGRLACYLRALGVGPELRVAVALERGFEMVTALWAILEAGAAYVPLDPSYPRRRLELLLSDARCPVLLTRRPLLSRLPGQAARTVCLDSGWETAAGAPRADPEPPLDPAAAAYVIYTSGSTGRPKGVTCSHRSIVNRLRWMQAAYPLGPEDRVLQKTPYSFDVSVWELFWPLVVGARLVMARPEGHKDTAYLCSVLTSERITTLHFVPSMLRVFLDQEDLATLTSVRRVFASGEALSHALAERFLASSAAELHNLYGPTEAAVDVTFHACRRGERSVPIGRPIANLGILLLDGHLRPVPIGVHGELHIGGVGLARGYLSRPDLTAERFVPDPFSGTVGARLYRTGDRTRRLADGEVEFLGRTDDQVKVRGFRVELGEIEAALLEHPRIHQAVVTADGGRLVAFCVAAGGVDAAPRRDELRGFLGDRLPELMVPATFVALESLPLSPNGKIDRRRLPAAGPARELAGRLSEPRTPAEKLLCRLWAEVLDLEQVSAHDNFFELGGDSILSIRIVSRARRQGVLLTPRDFFQHQTVAELARVAHWDERAAARHPLADQGCVTGPVPLTPIQRWFFERGLSEPRHANWTALWQAPRHLDPDRLVRAAALLERHHDALRLRFTQRPDGGWEQHNSGAEAPVPCARIDLSHLASGAFRVAVERSTAALQRGLDLGKGPLWRLTFFDRGTRGSGHGRDGRLHLVVHHLAVDGVSWTILREDLAALCRRPPPKAGDASPPVALPAKTTSYKAWAESLATAAHSEAWSSELGFWLDTVRRGPPLPLDADSGVNSLASAATVRASLSADETRRLLRRVPAAYRTRVDDVLLTAVVRGFRRVTGHAALLLELEGHGRDSLRSGFDLSRTVGWFTALYPVCLELPADDGLGTSLMAVKEALRALPRGGRGFGLLRYLGAAESRSRLAALPRPEILFNYLGQDGAGPVDDRDELSEPRDGPGPRLVPAAESAGAPHSRRGRRSHLLELVAAVRGGRLELHLTFSRNRHRRTTAEKLLGDVLDELRALIVHCGSPRTAGYTPSDFPLAGLDQANLDRLFAGDRGVEDVYPTTPTQEAVFYYRLYNPVSTAYFEHLTFVLEGELDTARLRRVGQRLLDRHPVLRTALLWESLTQPLQVVRRRAVLPWAEADWQGLTPARHRARLRRFIQGDRRRGFDVGQAPLLRWTLVRLGARRHLLVWSYHHLVLDGWSLPLLVQEFLDFYRAPEAPRPSVRPFRDFVAWLGLADRRRAADFWRRTLRGFSAATPVPFDRPPDGATAGDEDVRPAGRRLSAAATGRLSAFGRRHHLTLNTLVQAAWALLLARYSGEDDVLFGVTLAGRPAELVDVETMVGLFINTLPVRTSVAPRHELLPWLEELQNLNAELRQYDDSRLFELHRASGVPAGQALFHSLILFQNYPQRKSPDLAGPRVTAHSFRSFGTTSYPLTLTVKPKAGLGVNLAYDARRFDATTAGRMLALFVHLLESFVTHPAGRLAELPTLTGPEHHQLLLEHNDTAVAGGRGVAVPLRFADQSAETPDAVAVASRDGDLSYGELARRAHRLACRLGALGAAPEAAVGVFMVRSPEMVVALLAVLEAGAAYVPLDPLFPAARLAFILQEIRAPVVLTQERLAGDLPPTAARVIRLDGPDAAARLDAPTRAHAAPWPPSPRLAAPAYVIYTSGSTGHPKGVAIPHRALAAYVATAAHRFALRAHDRVLQFASISFDTSAEEIFPALVRGATLVLRNEPMLESPAVFARTLGEWRISVLDLPTAYWHQLAEALAHGVRLPGSLRLVVIGGESARPDRLRAWRRHAGAGVRLLNTYGPTEATIVATARDLTAARPASLPAVPLGSPLRGVRAHVLDRHARLVPSGAPGELCLGGAGLARGYFHRGGLTAERFVPDPWSAAPGERLYRTGDRVRRHRGGELEFLGRLDHQVKLRGLRIELDEIEAALRCHPAVRDAAVVVEDAAGESARLVAYVTAAPDRRLPPGHELRGFLKRSLPFYMLPAAFAGLEALPLLPSGKLDRRSLPAAERSPSSRRHVAPRSPTEKALAAIWADVLGVERVGACDEYFDLGGDSLLAVRLMARVERRFGVQLSLAQLFADFTVEALARRIDLRSSERPVGL